MLPAIISTAASFHSGVYFFFRFPGGSFLVTLHYPLYLSFAYTSLCHPVFRLLASLAEFLKSL